MDYIRVKPSNVYVVEFSGYREISDDSFMSCLPGLSNECEILSEDNPFDEMAIRFKKPWIYRPRIYVAEEQEGEERKTFNECFWAAVGSGAVASGLVPKKLVGVSSKVLGGNASNFASVPSIVAHYFPGIDDWLTKATRKSLTGKAPVISLRKWPPNVYVRMARTDTTLRFIGRWIPAIGWGLLAADLVVLDQCIANCRGDKSFLRTVWDEVFGIKPVY